MKTKTIYLLHFDRPLSHAKHYLGSTSNIVARLNAHRDGTSDVKILLALRAAGIGFELVATWQGDRRKERQMKKVRCAAQWCLVCRAAYLERKRLDMAKVRARRKAENNVSTN